MINSHRVFNTKGDSCVCVTDLLPRHHKLWNVKGLQHIFFHICLVQNCLSQVKNSETVYSLSGFWNCLSWKWQANGFLFTPAPKVKMKLTKLLISDIWGEVQYYLRRPHTNSRKPQLLLDLYYYYNNPSPLSWKLHCYIILCSFKTKWWYQ